ncbi:hypothetical protein LTR95_011395 [Oleoguttula sp. CCFEE 5521]
MGSPTALLAMLAHHQLLASSVDKDLNAQVDGIAVLPIADHLVAIIVHACKTHEAPNWAEDADAMARAITEVELDELVGKFASAPDSIRAVKAKQGFTVWTALSRRCCRSSEDNLLLGMWPGRLTGR